MNGQQKSWCPGPLILLVALSFLTNPGAEAQIPGFHKCMSSRDIPGNILDGPLGVNFFRESNHQNIGACANFCNSGAMPQNAEPSGDRSTFRPPYTYGLYQGNWCFCGNNATGSEVPQTECQHQIVECLAKPGAWCQRPGTEGFLVFSAADVLRGATSNQPMPPTPAPPPPPTANRPPNAPTVSPGAYEPPVVVPYGGGVQLAWTDNGDPDGDTLTFGVYVMQFDQATGQWVSAPSFRDQWGNPQAVWMSGTTHNYSTQAGLQQGTYYSWGVIACEVGRTADQPCAWSGWSVFRTQ
jgi:hypothetical protein